MFSNFISLGQACPTASSMSKYGLRSWSGPFDWLITDSLQWVLHFIENDFEDFLVRDNLERIPAYPKAFKDKLSGFVFHHDYEYPFESKYVELKQRYQKRIDRFRQETRKATCFLRSVTDLKEIKYISENFEYINRVIKQKNSENEIVFLLRSDVGAEQAESVLFRYYIMPGPYNGGVGKVIRNWFDGADEFLEYCFRNYDVMTLMQNIAFDRQHIETTYQIAQLRYETLLKLIDFDFTNISLPEEIILYGAGNIGQNFYKKIKGKCRVKCFVDKLCYGSEIGGISVKRLEEIEYDQNMCFIVTAIYDFESICKKIRAHFADANIISLGDILE